MSEMTRLELTIAGETFRLRVEADEIDRLRVAAACLNRKIAAFKDARIADSAARLALLAGLDVAHERLRERAGLAVAEDEPGDESDGRAPAEKSESPTRRRAAGNLNERIDDLIGMVDDVLK
jgi:cell division protein ZapA (FtsZ GTPase activity inhibitor)